MIKNLFRYMFSFGWPLVILVLFSTSFPGCAVQSCEDSINPELLCNLEVISDKTFTGYIVFHSLGKEERTLLPPYILPLSMVSDSSIYILKGDDRTDTLALRYDRHAAFESEGCGYTIELKNMQVIDALTTFDSTRLIVREFTDLLFTDGKDNENVYGITLYL